MKERLQLAGVQMTPDSLRSVIVRRQGAPTLRTGPRGPFLMNRKNIDPLALKIQTDPIYCPR